MPVYWGIFLFLKRIERDHVIFLGNKLVSVLGSDKANIGDKSTNATHVWLL